MKGIALYQVHSQWFLIVGFLISLCEGKFLCLFHFNEVCISPCSPSKNFKTQALGYMHIQLLFCFDLCVEHHFFTPRTSWRKVTLKGYLLSRWSHLCKPMSMSSRQVGVKIIATKFSCSIFIDQCQCHVLIRQVGR